MNSPIRGFGEGGQRVMTRGHGRELKRDRIFKKLHVLENYNFFDSVTSIPFSFKIKAQVDVGSGTGI